MATKKELIQFQIENRTLCSIDLPLFQSNVYSINATKQYLWNITGQSLACGTGGIYINGVYYRVTYRANSLQSLLDALTDLGFGFFCYSITEGQTYIYTTDDVNIYGQLDLCFLTPTTTTSTTTTSSTTTTTTAAPTTTTTTTIAPTTTTTTTILPTTTTTTTILPTTTTTTTLPPTSTTTTTTIAPTTSTTTTTTTAAPANRYSSANAANACTSGLLMTGVSYIGGAGLCTATQVQCTQFLSEIAGATIWVSFGGQVRRGTIDAPNVSGILTFDQACAAC